MSDKFYNKSSAFGKPIKYWYSWTMSMSLKALKACLWISIRCILENFVNIYCKLCSLGDENLKVSRKLKSKLLVQSKCLASYRGKQFSPFGTLKLLMLHACDPWEIRQVHNQNLPHSTIDKNSWQRNTFLVSSHFQHHNSMHSWFSHIHTLNSWHLCWNVLNSNLETAFLAAHHLSFPHFQHFASSLTIMRHPYQMKQKCEM